MTTQAILWDVDGTLLDFSAAEKAAVQKLFFEFGLGECTDSMVARYSAINDAYWKRLERGEITKAEVLVGRYRDFFSEIGVDPSLAETFNARYQIALGDTVVYRDDSLNLVKSLHGKVNPTKLDALIFDQFQNGYYVTGEQAGRAWHAGVGLMKK